MKTVKIIFLTILLLFSFSVGAYGEEDILSSYTEEYYDVLSDELTDETKEILEQSGFDSIDFEKILSSEPKDIIDFFLNTAKGTLDSPLKNYCSF